MIRWHSNLICSDPLDMLWHCAKGELACWLSEKQDQVGWVKYSHRGIQFLDKVEFPRKQTRYIFSPRFVIRYNQAFEQVVAGCMNMPRDARMWITPELYDGYVNLHRQGYAHSFEAWENGQLVGGAFGIQLGGYISCESMFHTTSNASKAVWGQTLLHLRQRGFKWIDTNCVATHSVSYGEEWVPQWRFEQMLREALLQRPSLADDRPCSPVPWQIRLALPMTRIVRAAARRLHVRPAAARPGIERSDSPPARRTAEQL
ncbi:MAG: leucyl/phenylalanyl-tRNA--protein transferase [Bacillota bacterium]